MKRTLFPEIIVNGEIVDAAKIAAEAQNHSAPKGKPGLAWRKAAQALVIRTLLLQRARARNLKTEPLDLGNKRYETKEEALIRGLLETDVTVELPDEDQIAAIWQQDPQRFRTPPLWEASHILCMANPGDEAACEKARARAQTLTKLALDNAKGFGHLANSESDCSSKDNFGALGQLGPGDTVPEFEAALEKLTVGEITAKPVCTRFGYHVIRLDAKAEGKVLPFDTVRPRIAEALEKSGWAKSAQNYTQDLVASAEVHGIDMQEFPV